LQQNAESQAFLASYLRDPQAQVAQITAFNPEYSLDVCANPHGSCRNAG